MAKFSFGIDNEPDPSEEPDDADLQGTATLPEEIMGPKPNGKGIRMTAFGKEINGVPVTEINRVERAARERLNKMDRDNWRQLAARCWKISTIEKPRLRTMVAHALLEGMHAGDPPDLVEYAAATGNDSLEDAADELSAVGGFEEKPYGIITGEIHFDESDLPEEQDEDDGPTDDDLEIGSVEA